MTELEKIRIFESKIKDFMGHNKTYVIENYSKLNKPILIVFCGGISNKIKMFDVKNGTDAIGEIIYKQHTNKVFISSYEVLSDYQQKGLGKLLLNLALAHADYNGIISVYGHATPINAVKDIDCEEEGAYDKIQQVLYKVYEKLGCKFDFYGENNTFYHEWQTGEKFNNLPDEFKNLIENFELGENKNHSV